MNWSALQNGSDIRGIALPGVPQQDVNLTPAVARILARAFVQWLTPQYPNQTLRIAIGTDSRLSGPALKEGFAQGVTACGATLYDCGLASTPALYMITVAKEVDAPQGLLPAPVAGVMITASHLPWNRNGLKFFTRNGGLEKSHIKELLSLAEDIARAEATASAHAPAGENAPGEVLPVPFMNQYAHGLVQYIRTQTQKERPLEGLHIVVDAGNGAGGFFVESVLHPLGAQTTGSQFLEPNGLFPHHAPNPENAAAMESICTAVRTQGAHLGIIFDTDVDRSAVVDHNGKPINRNALIALIGAIILREHPGSTIVTDSITSPGLTAFLTALGGTHHRFKRGYRNVINESLRLNEQGEESWLAIETSGHAALKENYFLDDGAFLVAKLLVEAARCHARGAHLTSLLATLQEPLESKEIRLALSSTHFIAQGQEVIQRLPGQLPSQWEIVSPNYEGIRVNCLPQRGWFLLRASLHDPQLVLNIESDQVGGVAEIEETLRPLLLL